MGRFASVYPLVSARELARPFTYRGDGLHKGAVVKVPFGPTERRGVVARIVGEAPPGVEPSEVVGVLGSVSPALVDLALWIADYYGTTPARALALVAPAERRPRGKRRGAAPPGEPVIAAETRPPSLTDEQAGALAHVEQALGSGRSLLLAGATGSGKTEIYLRACELALAAGSGAIVLVPEIALTPQTVGRFRARFGDRIAVLHSRLTDAARRDERARVASGEAPIVIGARSAVFAPVPRLALICVDEEHDASYKSDSDPRYDARTVAAKRAALEGAVAVFGSATPRAETWLGLERLDVGARVGSPMPQVRIVDMRRESGYPISAPLLSRLGAIADRGGRAILLLNRRGLAPAIHCRSCGTTRRCALCDVSLVLHADGRLRCHHCAYVEVQTSVCSSCGSTELARIGAGTQRLERELESRLPELAVFRLDAETARKPGAHASLLGEFARTERGVLVGTQMVAKGHHFAGVELAAVIDAGTELVVPDFRAEERTFQLVTQLAGRSGRDRPGQVIVQTFDTDARPVQLAARHAVEEFMSGELDRRRELLYPPFCHLIRVLVSGPDGAQPRAALSELRAELEGVPGVEQILGPAQLLRLRNRHRAQLIVKATRPRPVATLARGLLAGAARALRRDGLTAVVDVDPQTLF